MKQHPDLKNLAVIDHPLILHKLTLMRDKTRSTQGFKKLLKEISMLMAYELTRDFPVTEVVVETPITRTSAPALAGKKPVIVPILRAGLGMAEGIIELMPAARVGHIGLYRDEATKRPREYMVKLPSAGERIFFLLDPMLATGHSAAHAVDVLIRHGVSPKRILFMSLIAAPEGVKTLADAHPDVRVYTASLDECLDDNAYIVPGLGDAGDRMIGTK